MPAAYRIRWEHDGDVVVAEVGQPLKWGRPRPDGRVVTWSTGADVVDIEQQPTTWVVHLDPAGSLRGWANPVYCGDRVTIED